MRKFLTTVTLRALAATACLAAGSAANAELIYGVTTQNALVTFDSATPGSLSASTPITGLGLGEVMLGIDIRPATGELFGLGSGNNVYKINPQSGAATKVLTPGATPFALNGVEFGFDFNPTVDLMRVTSNADQNMRLSPITGGLASAAPDGNLKYEAGSPNPNIVASAYTNNFAGATSTKLYNIDSDLGVLVEQIVPPNDGVLKIVGPLGFDTTHLVGFDISGATGVAFASFTFPGDTRSQLMTINLNTGAASLVGIVGGTDEIRGLTVVPEPGSSLLLVIGAAAALGLRRR